MYVLFVNIVLECFQSLQNENCFKQCSIFPLSVVFFYQYSSFGEDVRIAVFDSILCSSSEFLVMQQCSYATDVSPACSDADDVSITCCEIRRNQSNVAIIVYFCP